MGLVPLWCGPLTRSFCSGGPSRVTGVTPQYYPGMSNTSRAANYLRHRRSMWSYAQRQEASYILAAPFFVGGERSRCILGLLSTAFDFLGQRPARDQMIYDRLPQSHRPQLVVFFNVSLRGAASVSSPHDKEANICRYCKTPARRRLDILCRKCGHVLPPQYDSYKSPGYSFFDLLELNPDFNLDSVGLNAKHKELQKLLHPDRNLHADEEERSWNDEHRKQVALAIATLRCPAKRVLHLLQKHFHCLPDEVEEEEMERVTDSELLTEILELNEALREVRTRDELNALEKKIRDVLEADEKTLAETFQEKDIDGVKRIAQRYMMHAGLLDRIKNWSADDTL